ncbi:MAG: efflux RND transporter periplasmic adaptor subunit [Variibacter sp.]|nr:efflux RND transporter periplasmic adaptor subunit [Variibacter sp.]
MGEAQQAISRNARNVWLRGCAGQWPRATALLAVLCVSACGERNTYQPPPPVEVGVRKPEIRKVTIYREVTGTTQPSKRVDLVARVQGFLEKIAYTDGERVAKDHLLFRIERAPYETNLLIAQAAVTQQQALLAQAESDLARQTALTQRQVASEARFEDARAKRDSAAAALAQANAQVQQAEINLSYTEIKAPFAGVVSARLADEGALVGAGGPTRLATLFQIDPLYVTFSISEQQAILARRRVGASGTDLKDLAPIPVEIGMQTEDGFPHAGQIDYVSPDLDAATGTLGVRAVLDNKTAGLIPGLFVRVRIPVMRDVEAQLVPDAALGADQQGRYALVVDENDTVVQRPVEIGDLIDGGLRIITSGLKPEDRVVVTGIQRASPGAKVKPLDAAAPAKATP